MKTMLAVGMAVACATVLSSGEVSAAAPVPALWYRADDGSVLVDADKYVTKWENQGTLGAAGDLTPNSGTPSNALELHENLSLADGKGVVFNAHNGNADYLRTADKINLGITLEDGATYFFVADWGTWAYGSYQSLFGLDINSGATRCGAFYYAHGDLGYPLRSYFYSTSNPVDFAHTGSSKLPGKRLLSCTACAGRHYGFSGGLLQGAANLVPSTNPNLAGYFELGWMGVANFQCLTTRVGEFRLYNQALTAAERFAVEGELAARHGCALNPEESTEIAAATVKDCSLDPCAIGDAPDAGKAVDEIPTAATSDALTVAFGTVPAADTNSLAYVGHDNGAGVERVWCLVGTEAARAIPVTLTFAAEIAGDIEDPRLFRFNESKGQWEFVTDAVLTATEETLSFALPAGWANARYRLLGSGTLVEPALRYAVDTVETNEAGQVTAWRNSGTFGAAGDLAPAGGEASAAFVRVSGGTLVDGEAVRFSGADYLTTADKINPGITRTGGATYFFVADWRDQAYGTYQTLFGFDTDGGKNRCGPFYYPDLSGVRTYYYATANCVDHGFTDGLHRPGRRFLEAVAYNNKLYGLEQGILENTGNYTLAAEIPAAGYFEIGHFGLDTFKHFNGDLGELRIYDRALTGRERFAVECELAALHHFDLQPEEGSEIPSGALHGCVHGAAVFGQRPDDAIPDPVALTFVTCGGLRVAFADNALPEGNSQTYVAHNGLTGKDRVWCIAGMGAARATGLSLRIDATPYGDLEQPRLCYRAGVEAGWARMSVALRRTADGYFEAEIPAGWRNGQYGITELTTFAQPAVWFRADKGVVIRDGKVVGWQNQGTFGSAADVAAVGDANVTFVENGAFPAAVHFDGSGYLESAEKSDFGITKKGFTWFVTVNHQNISSYNSIFGLAGADGEGDLYLGVFFYSSPWQYRAHYFNSGWTLLFGDPDKTVTPNPPGCNILSATADPTYRACVSGNAAWQGGDWNGTVIPGKMRVGKMGVAAYSALIGEIAELRVYDRPLSAVEHALVELEMAANARFPTTTAGAGMDPAALADHQVDAEILGRTEAARGIQSVPVYTWSDGVLAFAFGTDPSEADKSLTYIASDGGAAEFVPQAHSSREPMARTWYLSSAVPDAGCTLTFDCGAVLSDDFTYVLQRKGAGETAFRTLDAAPSVADGKVTFVLGTIGTGTYRLVKKNASGVVLIVR